MGTIHRLITNKKQQRQHTCPCGREVPMFANLTITSDVVPDGLFAITFHTQCECGQLFDVRKKVRR